MIAWGIWLLERFGDVWALGAVGLAGFAWCGAFTLPGILRATTQQLAVGLLVGAGMLGLAHHAYADGVAAESTRREQLAWAEAARQMQVLTDSATQARATAGRLAVENSDLEQRLSHAEVASHAHDAEPGLPVGSVRRLRALTAARRAAGKPR